MKIIISILSFIIFFSCTQSPVKNDTATQNIQMHDLAQQFSDLLPYITNKSAFHNPQNQELIDKKTQRLTSLAHSVRARESIKDSDPALSFISQAFENELNRAYSGLKQGHREYARKILSTMSGYCIRCHTRFESGPNFVELTLNTKSNALSPIVKGELFAATRQFDKALKEFETIIEDKESVSSRPFEWERAVRYSLAIAIRYERNQKEALKISKLVASHPTAPTFMKKDAQSWQNSLKQWKSDVMKPTLENIKKLINQAQALQEYPTDRAGDVLYLLASAQSHELLTKTTERGAKYSELLYLAGTCYEALRDLGDWTLHEHYYKACIENSPHTPIAIKCFDKYQQSIFAGYSGSSGTSLPSEVQIDLKKLEDLSKIQPK